MIVIGFISLILDYILLNISYFRFFFFPMFSLVFLVNSIIYKRDFIVITTILVLYSVLSGIIFPSITILILTNYLINKKNINYYLVIIIFLTLYDFLLYLSSTYNVINNIYWFIQKVYITIPINLLYSYILIVLNKKINKYKLV